MKHIYLLVIFLRLLYALVYFYLVVSCHVMFLQDKSREKIEKKNQKMNWEKEYLFPTNQLQL